VTSRVSHANIGVVSPEEKAEMTEALRKAARADKRAETAKDRTARRLRETILAAHEAGMKPSEIRDAIDRRYSDGHLSRLIHGKA
jgi:hypothetical protein